MENPYSTIPPANPKAVASVKALGDACAKSFVDLNSKFTAAYTKWKATWNTGDNIGSSSSSARADCAEFDALVALGPAIIPLVLKQLLSPDDFHAIHLYNALQNDQKMKVNPKNIIDSHILQRHASLLVNLNGNQNLLFDKYTEAWRDHIAAVATSSKSGDMVDTDDFDALIDMGKSIIPNIIVFYTSDKDAWWYILLDKIFARQTPQIVKKPEQYSKWETWFKNGADETKLPTL